MRATPLRLLCLLSLLIASSASAVTMAWTPIGNPGNACDSQPDGAGGTGCYGAVGYAYQIGTYEVTNAQYAEFLNAKAPSDPYGLYTNGSDPNHPTIDGISRSGSSGSYSYSAVAGRENTPVTSVSVFDAMRFANWLNNGPGSGDTETGSYTLLGGTAIPSNGYTVTRNDNAAIVLTSENEWYKAAYYDASSASYFAYPADSNAQTVCSTPTTAGNSANCFNAVGSPTNVGSYAGSASPYGTFDQGGNVWEWNETRPGPYERGLRGGGFYYSFPSDLAASYRSSDEAGVEYFDAGFRLAMVPEPGTGLLVIAGLLGLAARRWVSAAN
jgi:formylglycine-generating enzyme required for sulfatase activity